jgi:hypothetical protein
VSFCHHFVFVVVVIVVIIFRCPSKQKIWYTQKVHSCSFFPFGPVVTYQIKIALLVAAAMLNFGSTPKEHNTCQISIHKVHITDFIFNSCDPKGHVSFCRHFVSVVVVIVVVIILCCRLLISVSYVDKFVFSENINYQVSLSPYQCPISRIYWHTCSIVW